MSKHNMSAASAKPAAAKEIEREPAADLADEVEDGSGYSLESVVELTDKQLATMEEHLAGKGSLGPNLALMGFFAKAPGSQLIGIVHRYLEKQNQIDPRNTDQILYVEGIADYPRAVLDDNGEVKIEAGRYRAMFAFQIDAATSAFAGDDMIGARVHFSIKGRRVLGGGKKRIEYNFARFSGGGRRVQTPE